MAWAKNGTPDTLLIPADEITISDLTPLKFNVVMSLIPNNGSLTFESRFGNGSIDSTSNYAERLSFLGRVDEENINQTSIALFSNGFGASVSAFFIQYFINIATEEKLVISFSVSNDGLGTGVSPQRGEVYGKWVNTTDQTDHVQIFNTGSGGFDGDSNISALGTD